MYAVLYLMLHGIIWFSLSQHRSRWVTLWSQAGMVSAAGLALLALEGVLPQWLVVMVGQLCMAAGNFGRQYVLRGVDGAPSRRWLWCNGAFHVAYLMLNGGLFLAGATHKTMMVVFFTFYAVACWDFYLSGAQIRRRRQTAGALNLQWAGLVFTGVMGLKALALVLGWGAQDLFSPGWDQVALFAGLVLAISLLNFGFLQLFVDQFQQQRAAVELALVQERQQAAEAQLKSLDLAKLLRERDELMRQLTLSNKTAGMGALVASIAHELNQPLTTIVLKTELIESHLQRNPDPALALAEVHQLAELIRQDTRHAAGIIRTLRSMFATGKGEFARLDLALLVQEVVRIVRAQAERAGIVFDIRLQSPLALTGDATQLQQVVLNLLNNAIDALLEQPGQPSRVSISGQVRSGWVDLHISDNGCGMDALQQQDAFDLFKTSKSKGMGVGLWLSQSIVMSHGGRLSFESEPGQGTVFLLALPSQEHVLGA